MNPKKLFQNKTLQNAGWLIGGRITTKLLSFLVGILTARYLGPANQGLIEYVAAYITFFASFCNLGINSVIIKVFSDHPEEEGKVIGTTIGMRAISSFLSSLMIIGLVMVVDQNEPTTVLVAILSSFGLLFQIFDTFKQWFQSKLQSKYAALATVVSYIAVSCYKIFLLATGKSVAWFALATSVEYAVVALLLFLTYKKNKGPKLSFSLEMGKELLRAGSSFIIAGLMVSIYASTDKLMLKQLLDETAVGHYGLAVTLSTTWGFVLQAVIDSLFPSVIAAHKISPKEFAKKNRQMYAVVLYFSGIVSLLISIFAVPIVSILYGEAYLPAADPLRIVVFYTAFSYLGVARNAWMVCENVQKYLKYLYMASAGINVLLNFLLIPVFGTTGAAAASLITQVVTTILLPACIKPLRPNVKLMLEAVLLKDLLPKKKSS